MFVGMDFGRDMSETVIHESRGKGKYVVRYDLPVDPLMRSCRDLFDDDFKKKLSEFCVKRIKKVEAEILAWITRTPICYRRPCDAILDGIYGLTTPATFPRGNVCAERYEVTEFFLRFPRALPTELKGVAV